MLGSSSENNDRFSDKTVNELVRASFDMGEVKTGALIVVEKEVKLEEYENGHSGRRGPHLSAADQYF